MRTGNLLVKLIASAIFLGATCTGAQAAAARPNILVIVADDLGYSDIGAFGGEIDTPNLDALARRGVRLTGFHTAPTCSPTRAMLLTGADNHEVGLGTMAEQITPVQRGRPGYEGYLNDRSTTLAELLHDAGYRTVMAGKWHLGLTEAQSPAARGFERSFALLQGVHNHYGADQNAAWAKAGVAATYRENGRIARFPEGVYSADYFTDRLIGFLDEGAKDPRPFFAYLTFTEPHWPMQAPPELIAKYRGRYDDGPEALRDRRLARLKALGLVAQDVQPHALVGVPAWASLSPEQRALQARKMEVYAAMVERLDQNVGRLIQALKRSGRYDNTLIVFLSDNGPEGTPMDAPMGVTDPEALSGLGIDNSLAALGSAKSYVTYGPGWAQAGSAPSRLVKGFTTEGGIHTPAIVAGPGVAGEGRIVSAFLHVKDILPTAMDFAGAPVPRERAGRPVLPPEGHSWAAVLQGRAEAVRGDDEVVGWELFFRRAIRQGDWKAVYLPVTATPYSRDLPQPGRWELFDLRRDPGETTDLAEREPGRLKALIAAWDRYASGAGVVVPANLADAR